ncbi:MAG: ATPase, T2SS/T4P/T4SS family [Candidatus Omnitrophica bacterium]|nr:ATPase, T2SS/T4P/T4SS family [Candidatus Omnitrophota bacterium]
MDERIDLEHRLLDRIKEKIDLSQSARVKEDILVDAFLEFCKISGAGDCKEKSGLLRSEEDNQDFFQDFKGYGVIDPLLNDPYVEDIIINSMAPIYVHHAKDGFKKTDKNFSSMDQLNLLIKKLLVFSGSNNLKKIHNIDLPGMRGRVNIVYSPLGPDLTITKIRSLPLSIIDLIQGGVLNSYMAALLWLYIEGLGVRPANILISGGPGSGKTTLLNALLSFIPLNQHIIVIEDTFELVTDWIGNVSRLESDEEISLAELVKNSLRMRPERLIVGEVRGNEAQDMITAMNIGKYCMGTIHAGTVRETILRLQSHPMNVPEILVNLTDVFIVMKKVNLNSSFLRVMSEITETAGLEQKTVLISPLWKYDLASQSYNEIGVSSVYRDKLSQASGLSGKQILDEIGRRRIFLDSLSRADIKDIKEVSLHCEAYTHDPQGALSEVSRLLHS